MRRLTKILLAVGITLLLIVVLTLTLVIVLRREEWIVLEKSFSSTNGQCTTEWSGSSDRRRTRCKMPLICTAGHCKLPLSEGEGKSCLASPHLCATGLTCDPYLKICRRLISVGGSCTEQNAFLCESGICGYAATQTADGEPLGGRHSLSRYCIVKDLPPGAACDRFRHCVTNCLQCVQGVCKPVMSPMDQQQMLLEQQKELMLPLAVNGFSADPQPTDEGAQTQHQLRHLQQEGSEAMESEAEQLSVHHILQDQQQQQEVHKDLNTMMDEKAVRQAWDQRAAEVSQMLGETITAEELAVFFAVPRDKDGRPLENGEGEEAISGQQSHWSGEQQQLYAMQQQQQMSLGNAGHPARPQSVLNGSLAKRLARLFTGVSIAFSPEEEYGHFAPTFGVPMYGFPTAVPPPLSPTVASAAHGGTGPQQYAYGTPIYVSGVQANGVQGNGMQGNGVQGNVMQGNGMHAHGMDPQQQERVAAQLQLLQQQQQQQQQYQQGLSPYDSALEAMEASSRQGDVGESTRMHNTSEDDDGELEGLFFPGAVQALTNTLGLLGVPSRPPLGHVSPIGVPPFAMQRPPVPPRLPPVVPPLGTTPGTLPMGNVALGTPPIGVPLPALPVNPGLQTPVAPPPPFSAPVGPLPNLPNRLPNDFKGGCWIDRCCASHHYCSFLHAAQGCQSRKREGAACVGDSARECEDHLSCVNGECSPWFTSRHASAGDPIVLTDNVDLSSVCAPWQRFEYGAASNSLHMHDLMPPQMALPSPLETPNPYGNNLSRDVVKTLRKFSGRCVPLDKRSCVTDRECWGVGGFGFCDVRSKKCRTPAYPACLALLKDLYSCLWHEGRLRETTDDYIVSHVPRTPQFLLHETPISVNHVQSKCIPSAVRRKRAEFLKCVRDQGFTLERIVEVPSDWFKG